MHSYCFAPWCWFAFTEKHYVGRDSAGIPIINSAEGRSVVDLYGAATQFFGTPTWITLGAALLISTTAFIVMLLYVRAVDPKSKPGKTMPQPGPVVQGGALDYELSTAVPSSFLASAGPSWQRVHNVFGIVTAYQCLYAQSL
jgi:hypothetical protein